MGKRADIPRPHNNGRWTVARKRSFIISALRAATMRWDVKWIAINRAYVGKGKNPATGKPCKLHKCEGCGELFPKSGMKADHKIPVVDPVLGFQGWDSYIERMFPDSPEDFAALCDGCHASKTAAERAIRGGKLPVVRAVRRRGAKKV